MKSYMRTKGFYILNLVLVVGLMLVATTVIAQPPPPPPPPPPPGVPVDGGIIGLLAIGIGYGVKKIYSKN